MTGIGDRSMMEFPCLLQTQRDKRRQRGYACLRRLINEIAFLFIRPRTHSGRPSLFCLPRQNENMDVHGPGNTGSISEGPGISGNVRRPFDSLFVQGIKSFDFKIDLV